jgi:DNA helicase II / ATP-dependent DNA helicase PcrA
MRPVLTREQKRAATNGALRAYILAAPGSGKTTVAAERYGVVRFTGQGDGRSVLALSFARSARGELESRVRERWGSSALGWPHMTSTLDGLHFRLVSHLLRKDEIQWLGGHTELVVLDSWRSQPHARFLTPDYKYCRVARLTGRSVTTVGVNIGRAFFGYGNKARHEAMLAQGICTHDEIRSVLRSALANPQLRAVVAEYLTTTTKAVIVDEIFDGNRLDLEIVRIAAEAGIPTTVIGDPWQALYEFRGAQPELVPAFVAALQFETFPVSESFRFKTEEMKTLAAGLRAGQPVHLEPGAPAHADVVLGSHWLPLWDVADDVLPLAFGQIGNQTDAALALLLAPLAVSHFGPLARAAPEAAVALNLAPELVRDELPTALAPVLNLLSGGTPNDAEAALALLRQILRDAGGRSIPTLQGAQEQKKVEALVALSRRLDKPRLVPGMTVHQAKGREWTDVAVHLGPAQLGRLASGLEEELAGDREIYVALTRAKESVRLV